MYIHAGVSEYAHMYVWLWVHVHMCVNKFLYIHVHTYQVLTIKRGIEMFLVTVYVITADVASLLQNINDRAAFGNTVSSYSSYISHFTNLFSLQKPTALHCLYLLWHFMYNTSTGRNHYKAHSNIILTAYLLI